MKINMVVWLFNIRRWIKDLRILKDIKIECGDGSLIRQKSVNLLEIVKERGNHCLMTFYSPTQPDPSCNLLTSAGSSRTLALFYCCQFSDIHQTYGMHFQRQNIKNSRFFHRPLICVYRIWNSYQNYLVKSTAKKLDVV